MLMILCRIIDGCWVWYGVWIGWVFFCWFLCCSGCLFCCGICIDGIVWWCWMLVVGVNGLYRCCWNMWGRFCLFWVVVWWDWCMICIFLVMLLCWRWCCLGVVVCIWCWYGGGCWCWSDRCGCFWGVWILVIWWSVCYMDIFVCVGFSIFFRYLMLFCGF